ncbi:MAG: MFS transporter, partial [Sphingopyxis sp.]
MSGPVAGADSSHDETALATASMDARQKRAAFAVLMIALVLEIVDMTIVNVALPSITADLGGGPQLSQWVTAGYSASFAIMLMLGGRLGDVVGYRAMFMLGAAGFTLSSLGCGMAGGAEQLVAARIAQGATGALMAPQVMAIVQLLYPPLERVQRLAWVGVIGGLSALLGPAVGGVLIAGNIGDMGWRTIFLINIPIGLFAVGAAWRVLPAGRSAGARGVDVAGAALFGGATALALVIMIERHWAGVWGQCAAVAGAAMLAAAGGWHVRRRSAAQRPTLFPPALLAGRLFAVGLVANTIFAAATGAFLFTLSFAMQRELRMGALGAGLVHIPFSLGVMLGISLIGMRYIARFGRQLLAMGAAVMLAGCGAVWLAIAIGGGAVPALAAALLVAGVG